MRSHEHAWPKTGAREYEENIPAEQPSPSHEARFPPSHAHARRPSNHQCSPIKGTQVSLCLIHSSQVERLRNHSEFVGVLRHRNRVSSADLVVHYATERLDTTTASAATRRLGLAVSKAVGNAVARNTVKRRIRILARRYEAYLPQGCDIVVRAKSGAASVDFASLDNQVAHLFRRVAEKVGSSSHQRMEGQRVA